jgi:hypothetical protein
MTSEFFFCLMNEIPLPLKRDRNDRVSSGQGNEAARLQDITL